jgi:hypothetical protein
VSVCQFMACRAPLRKILPHEYFLVYCLFFDLTTRDNLPLRISFLVCFCAKKNVSVSYSLHPMISQEPQYIYEASAWVC